MIVWSVSWLFLFYPSLHRCPCFLPVKRHSGETKLLITASSSLFVLPLLCLEKGAFCLHSWASAFYCMLIWNCYLQFVLSSSLFLQIIQAPFPSSLHATPFRKTFEYSLSSQPSWSWPLEKVFKSSFITMELLKPGPFIYFSSSHFSPTTPS